jgi:REP element-mobilizing transposase RayT
MRYIKVWIHLVWSTKNREPLLTSEIRFKVLEHILQNGRSKGIFIDFVNGYTDHVHCLVSLGAEQSLSKIMHLIKGESSFWINKNHLSVSKFEWQTEYFAASVSESNIDRVRQYIKNQEKHHTRKTFQDEYDEMILKWGFQKLP